MFNARRAAVQKMLQDGKPLGSIEDWINGLSEPQENKDALWLIAWSQQPLATEPSCVDPLRAARGRVAAFIGMSQDSARGSY